MSSIQGLVFPLELSSGKSVIAEGSDLIESSIKNILSWNLFTREYEDYFGSRIFEALENQNDSILKMLVKRFIIDSIERWDERIELNDIRFDRPSPESLVVDIDFTIRDLQVDSSLTYTFYTN